MCVCVCVFWCLSNCWSWIECTVNHLLSGDPTRIGWETSSIVCCPGACSALHTSCWMIGLNRKFAVIAMWKEGLYEISMQRSRVDRINREDTATGWWGAPDTACSCDTAATYCWDMVKVEKMKKNEKNIAPPSAFAFFYSAENKPPCANLLRTYYYMLSATQT